MKIDLEIQRLSHAPKDVPSYATPGAAGMDLRAAIAHPVVLMSMDRCLIPTGFIFVIPSGYEGQIRPRSGLSLKCGLTLINCVGTVDSDYREEVRIPVVNLSKETVVINPGERIAQLIIAPVPRVEWVEVPNVAPAPGRSGGFGSTGSV